MYGNSGITYAGALALALGIAIQNFPEGAIVSKPLLGEGVPKVKTFRKHSNIGTISFAAGFILMTALDVGLG